MSTTIEEIRAGLTEDKLEELRAEHGRIYTLPLGEEDDEERCTIVFRWAKPAEAKRYEQTLIKDKNAKRAACVDLMRDVVVYPPRAGLDVVCDHFALVPFAVASEVTDLLAGGAPERAKKFVPARKTA